MQTLRGIIKVNHQKQQWMKALSRMEIIWNNYNQKDMSLEQVNKTGLMKMDRKEKLIIIDQAHNLAPVKDKDKKDKGVSNEQLLKTLQTMEQRLEDLSARTGKK